MEVLAKLFEADTDDALVDRRDAENNYNQVRKRYSLFKTLVEDIPLIIMQSLFLHQDVCREGLNTIVILSLYFNGICILYTISNLCNQQKSKNTNKIYQKELERLRDYYDSGNTQTRVVAEFYIEDNHEAQKVKLQALIDYLAENDNDVNNFNFSTNQMGPKTLGKLGEIIVNCTDSLQDLTLSRCRLSSGNIHDLLLSEENGAFKLTPHLLKLNLSENRIGDKGAQDLATYISTFNMESLISLNLESNFIGMPGALSLLEAVRKSTSLFQVSLRKNKIPPLNGVSPQENAALSVLIFEMLRSTQMNFIRYAIRKGESSSLTQNKSRPIEQYIVRLCPNNESFDRVMSQMFRVDPY